MFIKKRKNMKTAVFIW